MALNNDNFLDRLINILRTVRDEEIVANACKCIRISMREEANLDLIVKK
jgi:hypothetical protein